MSRLSQTDRLHLQQLRLLEWLDQQEDKPEQPGSASRPSVVADLRAPWTLTHGITLAPWQEDARRAWIDSGRQGTVKVVTGAGKTMLAFAAAEELQRTLDPELRVAVVVPTIVLLNQWYEALIAHSSLPTAAIGRMGGGHEDDFAGGCRVLIAVLASAYRLLPRTVREAGVAEHLLLVVDECHRAGAPEQSAVLSTPRSYALGLSATPERSDDAVLAASGGDAPSEGEGESDVIAGEHDASPIERALGRAVYELSLAEAVEQGILPPFELHHFGLSLSEVERQRHDELTRRISDTRKELRESSGAARKAGSGEAFLAWCRRVGARRSDEVGALARRFVGLTTDRKRLLYAADSRRAATLALVRQALAERDDSRIILFHESINEVTTLFELLLQEGIPAAMEHSKLPDRLRDESLELFRKGAAKVIVSARSLIEGFNVPAADLGIVVASSSSPRQRIQSVGRVLRRHRTADAEEKVARVCVLYIRDSTDDLIYERADWGRITGVERNRFFSWDPPAEPVAQDGPPRTPLPAESEISFETLQVGAEYPGAFEGEEYSCDTRGNVTNAHREHAVDAQGIAGILRLLTGGVGRFRVTPRMRAVLVRRPEGDRWRTLYGGCLERSLEFRAADAPSMSAADPARSDAVGALPSIRQSGVASVPAMLPAPTERSADLQSFVAIPPSSPPVDFDTQQARDTTLTDLATVSREPAPSPALARRVTPAADERAGANVSAPSVASDSGALQPGDLYSGATTPAEEYKFSRKRGGVIEKRVRDGWVFATGTQAEHLVRVLSELSRSSPVSKFYVNAHHHAFWRVEGLPRFIAALDGNLSFPAFDDHQ